MLTRVRITNFKRFDDVNIELGGNTVFIGPNDSGKTTALQALALWELGLRRWIEKHGDEEAPPKRPGATINRRDLIAIPSPSARLLWRDLHTHQTSRQTGRQSTANVFVDVVVSGVDGGTQWECGLEFYYANPESFYCRPIRLSNAREPERMPVPSSARDVRVAFLPPMSGLAALEPKLEPGRIDVLLGEGQTAQVLRNLCYRIFAESVENGRWQQLVAHIRALFGIELLPPEYLVERGEITMAYRTHRQTELDISSAGRGCQQVLLVLAHLLANPGTVLLIDEPDAHLEILRQRQVYQLLTEVAGEHGSQIIAASHSEVLLNEAADRDTLVAFVGKQPHRIDDRGSQAAKALKEIGFDQYYQAEQTGWVLYLEGSTDLAILRAFARALEHPALGVLARPFVHYVGNHPETARHHFFGLADAKPDLVAFGLFDRDVSEGRVDTTDPRLQLVRWRQQEIENYVCDERVLLRYARGDEPANLFDAANVEQREATMRETMGRLSQAYATRGDPSPWSADVRASEFLDRLFELYFDSLGLPMLMRKSDYHQLAELMAPDEIPDEVTEKLDMIAAVAQKAQSAPLPGDGR